MHIKVPEKNHGWSNRSSLGDFDRRSTYIDGSMAKASNCNSFWSCTDNKDKIAWVLGLSRAILQDISQAQMRTMDLHGAGI